METASTSISPSAQPNRSPLFANLLRPGRIGTLETRNRIIVTSMGVSLSNPDGTVGDRLINYHVEQARGGAGLIVSGVTGVAWPVGAVQNNQTAISSDRFIPDLTRLTNAVHAEGAKIAAQLHHGGPVAIGLEGHDIWVASPIRHKESDLPGFFLADEISGFVHRQAPGIKVLEASDIEHVVRQFSDAAVRARSAGFDGVEIHGGHGYLLSSFLSPSTNYRQDQYGGSLENRARLLLEVIGAIRRAVGADFPVWVKLDSREVGKQDGITLDDARVVARWAEAAGADAITVSAYHDVSVGKLHSASNIPHEPGAHIFAARAIKSEVKLPVIASGRIEAALGDTLIANGDFDFLAMGRKILADPHLPAKLQQGREADVRPCIYCYTCVSTAYLGQSVRCAVRPETGFESLRWIPRTDKKLKVVIIGGGPAGMEAARRLSEAGHAVTLLEQGARLGGTLQFAGLAYEPNQRLLDWLKKQVADAGIDVRLKTPASIELVSSLKPDIVLIATGAVRELPPIAGADHAHVFSGDDMRNLMLGTISDAIKRKTGVFTRLMLKMGALTGATANLDLVRKASHWWMPLGKRITIIGGELVGLELAEFLIERGREVTVVGESSVFGAGLQLVRRMRVVTELGEHGVKLYAGASSIQIHASSVTFTSADNARHEIPCDHVIVATGARSNPTLGELFRQQGFEVREFGDAVGVGYIEGAMRGAAEVVAQL